MTTRRTFLGTTLLAATGSAFAAPGKLNVTAGSRPAAGRKPRIVSTWNFGVGANAAAWKAIAAQGSALDASIMDGDGRCGAVAALEDIDHPISVARKVMENTPHVLLVGAGAQQFAISQGFKKTPLLTDTARKAWEEWRKESKYQPQVNAERAGAKPGDSTNHDTLGILAVDAQGRLAGACTTSGMAWKLRGRVGDSPIVGAGLYVDNEVGAATASGVGEEMIRSAGAFLVVEFMRQGKSPAEACRAAIERIVRKRPQASKAVQVCFLALNKHGEVGACALQDGFVYAVCDGPDSNALTRSVSIYPA